VDNRRQEGGHLVEESGSTRRSLGCEGVRQAKPKRAEDLRPRPPTTPAECRRMRRVLDERRVWMDEDGGRGAERGRVRGGRTRVGRLSDVNGLGGYLKGRVDEGVWMRSMDVGV
jgi:hypothetical protein